MLDVVEILGDRRVTFPVLAGALYTSNSVGILSVSIPGASQNSRGTWSGSALRSGSPRPGLGNDGTGRALFIMDTRSEHLRAGSGHPRAAGSGTRRESSGDTQLVEVGVSASTVPMNSLEYLLGKLILLFLATTAFAVAYAIASRDRLVPTRKEFGTIAGVVILTSLMLT